MTGQESQEFISDVRTRGFYLSLTLGTAKFNQSCTLNNSLDSLMDPALLVAFITAGRVWGGGSIFRESTPFSQVVKKITRHVLSPLEKNLNSLLVGIITFMPLSSSRDYIYYCCDH